MFSFNFRSKAGKFFKYFSDHLSQLTTCESHQVIAKEGRISTPAAHFPSDMSHGGLSVTRSVVHRVELVNLLTDAAGILRENSQSKQCFNLCYAINKNSKAIVIDILPSTTTMI